MLKENNHNSPVHYVDRQTPGTVSLVSSAVMTDKSERMFLSMFLSVLSAQARETF